MSAALTARGEAVVADARGVVRVWATDPPAEKRSFETNSSGPVAVSADGKWSAGCDARKHAVQLWDVAAGGVAAYGIVTHGWSRAATSGDGRLVLTEELGVSGAPAGSGLWVGRGGAKNPKLPTIQMAGLSVKPAGGVTALAVSADGRLYALAASDGTAVLLVGPAAAFSPESVTVRPLEGAGRLTALAFTPDGRHLAGAGPDGKAWLWTP